MVFEPIPKEKLPTWIKGEVKERGGAISLTAARYLSDHAGHDIWYVGSLMDQLVAYTKGREIELDDTQLFLEEKVDDNIFNMVDAIVAGNKKLGFQLLEAQRKKGEDDAYIYLMIVRQFRILLEMRDLFNRNENTTSSELAKELGLHPFVVKKSLPLIRKYSLDRLKTIYHQLLDIDTKTKTGLADQSLLLDLFTAQTTNF